MLYALIISYLFVFYLIIFWRIAHRHRRRTRREDSYARLSSHRGSQDNTRSHIQVAYDRSYVLCSSQRDRSLINCRSRHTDDHSLLSTVSNHWWALLDPCSNEFASRNTPESLRKVLSFQVHQVEPRVFIWQFWYF